MWSLPVGAKCTPGAISPAVTQANLKSTICRKGGYTSEVRPSAYVTGKEKKLNAASYGYTRITWAAITLKTRRR